MLSANALITMTFCSILLATLEPYQTILHDSLTNYLLVLSEDLHSLLKLTSVRAWIYFTIQEVLLSISSFHSLSFGTIEEVVRIYYDAQHSIFDSVPALFVKLPSLWSVECEIAPP